MSDPFASVRDSVEQVLMTEPLARDCDKVLIIRVWLARGEAESFIQNGQLCLKIPSVVDLTPPESITRVRREFQSKNLFLSSDTVFIAREDKRDVVHSFYAGGFEE